jgi:hypothetical protein
VAGLGKISANLLFQSKSRVIGCDDEFQDDSFGVSGQLSVVSDQLFPTLATKTKTWQGWGTRSIHNADNCN